VLSKVRWQVRPANRGVESLPKTHLKVGRREWDPGNIPKKVPRFIERGCHLIRMLQTWVGDNRAHLFKAQRGQRE
jgi:hypothetical protein